jgi:hypothetical protein
MANHKGKQGRHFSCVLKGNFWGYFFLSEDQYYFIQKDEDFSRTFFFAFLGFKKMRRRTVGSTWRYRMGRERRQAQLRHTRKEGEVNDDV